MGKESKSSWYNWYSRNAFKVGTVGGIVAGAGTLARTHAGLASPLRNLGAYAIAQKMVGGGAATSSAIKTLGGPIVFGCVWVGIAALSTGAGSYATNHLVKWVKKKFRG